MRHSDFWKALDKLAQRNGLTASGLARAAGLDPTSFNKSKRNGPDGQPRWLSMESLSKTLTAVGASLDDFAALADGRGGGRTAPLVGFAKAGNNGYFDEDGFPIGDKWSEVRFPGIGDEPVYALEITGDSMEPVYRAGDRIVVAPGIAPRKGDRVVARLKDGEMIAKQIGRMNERSVELLSLNPDYPPRQVPRSELSWMAKILWASQ
jgi:phage repressor protein C with HTH and peptisase S24 domain